MGEMSKKDELIEALKELEASGELDELEELDELDAMAIFPLPPRKNMHIFLVVTLINSTFEWVHYRVHLAFCFFSTFPRSRYVNTFHRFFNIQFP